MTRGRFVLWLLGIWDIVMSITGYAVLLLMFGLATAFAVVVCGLFVWCAFWFAWVLWHSWF